MYTIVFEAQKRILLTNTIVYNVSRRVYHTYSMTHRSDVIRKYLSPWKKKNQLVDNVKIENYSELENRIGVDIDFETFGIGQKKHVLRD